MQDFHAHYTAEGWQAVVLNVSIGLIIAGYVIIALQFWRARKVHTGPSLQIDANFLRERARHAFLLLLAIFILCGLSGYLPRLVQIPLPIFVTTHALLATATWWYILSRQAVVIAEAMSSRDRP